MNEQQKAEALANCGIDYEDYTVDEYEWDLVLHPKDRDGRSYHVMVDGGWAAHHPEGPINVPG